MKRAGIRRVIGVDRGRQTAAARLTHTSGTPNRDMAKTLGYEGHIAWAEAMP
jgi:hypothetical protein